MTPCEELGYKVGDEFVVVRGNGSLLEGDIVYLPEDDGTNCPKFSKKEGRTELDADSLSKTTTAYLPLDWVTKIEEDDPSKHPPLVQVAIAVKVLGQELTLDQVADLIEELNSLRTMVGSGQING